MPKPSETAVEFRAVTRRFALRGPPAGFKHALLNLPAVLRQARARPQHLALDQVSFRVEAGEGCGIFGPNGSGKSTLLALAAGVLRPSSGQVLVRGRACPLLALGAGFHGDLTGRENAVLNGMILGLSRREARARLPQVEEFAGVGAFLDEPLRTWSSGMVARLGFAVAVHTDPEILLVDEVLAVGDAAFQARCLDRLAALRRAGTTLLLVGHDRATLARHCDRILHLQAGRLAGVEVTGAPPAAPRALAVPA